MRELTPQIEPAIALHRSLSAPGRARPADILALQRMAGNRAVQRLLTQRLLTQRAPAKPEKPPAPTFDQIAQDIGPALGGPYKDYAAFASTMVAGNFLGHSIDRGVRPELLTKLHQAEKSIDAEYTKSGNPKPQSYGIKSVGGFRWGAGMHGWGLAIDIDAAQNTYIMHEEGWTPEKEAAERKLDQRLVPVYNRIAEFILNDPVTLPKPIGGPHQSIIPVVITSSGSLSGARLGRDARRAEFYDRLKRESDAMKKYFELMKGTQADRDSFIGNEWKAAHQGQPAPDSAGILKQMWEDYALLGGAVPATGPPGVQDYQKPEDIGKADRPFNSGADPAGGFLTIPREVVLGLGHALTRWGAIDFQAASGDVMHFDDKDGVGVEIAQAKARAQAKIVAAAAAAQP